MFPRRLAWACSGYWRASTRAAGRPRAASAGSRAGRGRGARACSRGSGARSLGTRRGVAGWARGCLASCRRLWERWAWSMGGSSVWSRHLTGRREATLPNFSQGFTCVHGRVPVPPHAWPLLTGSGIVRIKRRQRSTGKGQSEPRSPPSIDGLSVLTPGEYFRYPPLGSSSIDLSHVVPVSLWTCTKRAY